MISASGVLNGVINTVTFGAVSSDPFNFRARLSDENKMWYDNAVTVGKIGIAVIPSGKTSSNSPKTPAVEMVPVGGKGSIPVAVKTQPLTPPVVPFAQQNSSDNKGSGKNAQHKNQKAKESAQEKYEAAKEKYNILKSKPNITKEDKAAEAKAKTEMNHQKRKMDETRENHSQKAKGSN